MGESVEYHRVTIMGRIWEEAQFMELEVVMIQDKEELSKLTPFKVEHALWGTKEFPKTYGYIGFVPEDGFYLKMICEESNPLRNYTNDNDPVYKDSAMEAFLMFEPPGLRETLTLYLSLEANANGALTAAYGEKRMYRTYFTAEEHQAFECHAQMEENEWSVEMRVPVWLLEKVYGNLDLGEGSYFTCNFYKISETAEIEHYASFSPILTSIPSFHLPEYFAEAQIVAKAGNT